MTTVPPEDITDPSRPRPVRIAAWLGALAQAVLAVLALTLHLAPELVAALLGVIVVGQLGGWLLVVEQRVTPTADPRAADGVTPLVPGRRY